MNKEQEELQFIGFFGTFGESFNIISSCRRIFGQITLTIIFPLSFIFLAHIEISHLIFKNILKDENALDRTQIGSPSYSKLSDILSSEWCAYFTFKIVYFVVFVILSLLSTSAIVYTVACIYTTKDITFQKVMSVVPKVWKRLMITFIWNFVIIFIYNVAAVLFIVAWLVLTGSFTIGIIITLLLLLVYFLGFIYISVVWHLACVVSVLEDVYGMQAMLKSKELIKGKMGVAISVFIAYNLCFFGIEMLYEMYVVLTDSILLRICFGSACLNLLVILMLFGLVIQTVIYFICKSYHHENIDKSLLSDHLEVYLGDYVPLKSADLQLEQFYA